MPVADQCAGQLQQAEVEVGSAFVAGAQPLEGMQPGEPAFDDPAVPAQSGAVSDAAAGEAWRDAASSKDPPVLVVVVAAVGEQLPRLAQGPSAPAPDGRDRAISGMSWVMSLRLPPVRATASGMPPASQIRCCLEPGRPRSTGGGPTWSPL